MKKLTLPISLIIPIAILLAYAFAKPLMTARAITLTADDAQANISEQGVTTSNLSCADPSPTNMAACQAIEREILASTVHLMMYSSLMHVEGSGYRILSGNGHATIKEGRYLVTHNHYDEALIALLQQGDPENLITVNVFDSNGEVILRVPAQTVSVPVVDHESIILDFGERDGLGVFAALGLPSASFLAQPSISLQSGVEVAQVDWDGSSSHVDWVTVGAVTTISETLGASGGGLFWQGHHIGNNWSRSPQCGQGMADGTAPHSTVALNSQLVAAS